MKTFRSERSVKKHISAVAFLSLLINGCGEGTATKYVVAGEDATKAMRRMEAVTQVGANRSVYQQNLIELQVVINESIRKVPADSLLVEVLSRGMRTYVDAGHFWELQGYSRVFCDSPSDPEGTKMVREYAAVYISIRGSPCRDSTGTPQLQGDPSEAIQHAWQYAVIHRQSAEKLLSHKNFSPQTGS